jgi:hypothetical protein
MTLVIVIYIKDMPVECNLVFRGVMRLPEKKRDTVDFLVSVPDICTLFA